jgi:flagellin
MFHRYGQGLTTSQATSVQLFDRADSNWNSLYFDLVSTGTTSFDVYAGNVDDDTIEFQNVTVTTGEVRLDSQFFANATISSIDTALHNLNDSRAEVGAQMNRIESVISTLQITKENSAAAKSRIVDADYAAETARLAKSQILQQASISVLAQANSRPEMVLALLRDL